MHAAQLGALIAHNHDALLARCRTKTARTVEVSHVLQEATDLGLSVFLSQLTTELGSKTSQTDQIRRAAANHGQVLFFNGCTLGDVVHDYGNVCQSVTDIAVESAVTISASDFRTLNRCLDDAIAGAVSEYARQQRRLNASHGRELQTLVDTALAAFDAIQHGAVGPAGASGSLLRRSLTALRERLTCSEFGTAPIDGQ